MKSPKVPISWGEMVDKLSILRIKREKFSTDEALANVEIEYQKLLVFFELGLKERQELSGLERKLRTINLSLWDIENKIREKEAEKMFDNEFIELARSVYAENDKRSELKREINLKCKSDLFEEKEYSKY